jgi:hypothetical protein
MRYVTGYVVRAQPLSRAESNSHCALPGPGELIAGALCIRGVRGHEITDG